MRGDVKFWVIQLFVIVSLGVTAVLGLSYQSLDWTDFGALSNPTIPAACAPRVAILLAGYGSRSEGVATTFSDIIAQVLTAVGYVLPPIKFSYNYPLPYTPGDTYIALPNRGVAALHSTITDLLHLCPDTKIDLIGHSLGGVVAWEYISLYGLNTAEGGSIAHVVTLDSPVNGSTHETLLVVASVFNLSQLFGSPTGLYLAAEGESPQTVPINTSMACRLAPRLGIRTIGSYQDLVVPSRDALIPGVDFGLNLGLLGDVWGHSQVLHDSRALSALRNTLSGTPQMCRLVTYLPVVSRSNVLTQP